MLVISCINLKTLPSEADLLELRLDLFPSIPQELPKSHLFILTLRSEAQGGHFKGSEAERLKKLLDLARLKPAYIDVENHVPLSFIQELKTLYPDQKVILSHHDFEKTPDLDALYIELKKKPADLYKIATQANSSLDALNMLEFLKRSDKKVVGISMGPLGEPTRILGPIFGSPLTYASSEEGLETAPGQLSADILMDRYHFGFLNASTSIYGLMGDPVDKSISDLVHNPLMHALELNCVYVKFRVKKEEVPEFLMLAEKLSFKGLSVTMPLKETLGPKPVNTLKLEKNTLLSTNTDGVGACNAIEETFILQKKNIVILGAGGAAQAIAEEALKRGAKVTLLNRDVEKAKAIAENLGCQSGSLDEMPLDYGLIINCTPVDLTIDFIPNTFVMDIRTRPRWTPFLKAAHQKGCNIIFGYKMFIEQALAQYTFWQLPFPHHTARPLLEHYLSQVLL